MLDKNLAEQAAAKGGAATARAATKRPPKIDRRKAPQTKTRILDAAEALFAQRGFDGVSLRDIAQRAGVQLALTHYHCGAKEDLFRAVVDRRAADHVRSLREALEAAIAASSGVPPSPEAIVRAFLSPILRRWADGGPGWKNYVQLLARVANQPQTESFQAPVNEHYDNVVRAYVAQIQRSQPGQDAADMHWGFYFLQTAITHILLETGVADRQSNGLCQTRDVEHVLNHATRFFAAGFRHMQPGA
ncbi:MAG: TetR/AcrR family transcriptional regulator [Sphingomonadales bacterium]